MIKAWTDTGILSDAYEENEYAAVIDKFGDDFILSELEYKNLQKREPKEDIVNDIKEKVNKRNRKSNKNKSDKTDGAK